MQAVILSGGEGTRLHPFTKKCPKPMLPINKIPHLEIVITQLVKMGIRDIILSTQYLHKSIEEYFGNGFIYGANIQYQVDGDKALGTAGALKKCEHLIKDDKFFVLNGDILTSFNLNNLTKESMKYFRRNDKFPKAVIAYTLPENPLDYGLLVLDGYDRILDFVEKPDKIDDAWVNYGVNAGMYFFDKRVFSVIEENKFSMLEKDILPLYAKNNELAGCYFNDYWIDIGTPERYKQANIDFANGTLSK